MTIQCSMCTSSNVRINYRNVFHKVDKSFGPFDLFLCGECGSMGTANPPSAERLAKFYQHYDEHRPVWYNAGAASEALAAQYRFYAKFLSGHMPEQSKTWVDIGAGHGEVAQILKALRPETRGILLDIGERPPGLAESLEHKAIDLNQRGWLAAVGRKFDFVYSVAVWEHVVSPIEFAEEALSLVAPGGKLILITPDNGSLARRVLGTRWPYFEPGEHLTIASRSGADACIRISAGNIGLPISQLKIQSIPLHVQYSISYLFRVLRLDAIAKFVPVLWSAPLPTGILCTIVEFKA